MKLKFQTFIQQVEDLNPIHSRAAIRKIENKIISGEPNEVKYWSRAQHKAAIQSAKERFDELNSGILCPDLMAD